MVGGRPALLRAPRHVHPLVPTRAQLAQSSESLPQFNCFVRAFSIECISLSAWHQSNEECPRADCRVITDEFMILRSGVLVKTTIPIAGTHPNRFLSPTFESLNLTPEPQTLNPEPYTLNPKP